jgi:hypothetical protein
MIEENEFTSSLYRNYRSHMGLVGIELRKFPPINGLRLVGKVTGPGPDNHPPEGYGDNSGTLYAQFCNFFMPTMPKKHLKEEYQPGIYPCHGLLG